MAINETKFEHYGKDEVGVIVQIWLWVQVEFMA